MESRRRWLRPDGEAAAGGARDGAAQPQPQAKGRELFRSPRKEDSEVVVAARRGPGREGERGGCAQEEEEEAESLGN